MAQERPIYSTESDNPEDHKLSFKDGVIVVGTTSGMLGGGSGWIWGSQVGVEVTVGWSSMMGGVILSFSSADRAEAFAREGRKTRAYVEALRSSFESALALAVPGALVGHGLADITGAIVGGGIGVFVGGFGNGQVNFGRVSQALRERTQQ